jgi:hypothetical protein
VNRNTAHGQKLRVRGRPDLRPQRLRSIKGSSQSSQSFRVTAGEPFSQREPAGPPLPDLHFERIRQERVISHAPKQTHYRPNENAAPRAGLDNDDTDDATGRKGDEGATAKAEVNKDGSNPR